MKTSYLFDFKNNKKHKNISSFKLWLFFCILGTIQYTTASTLLSHITTQKSLKSNLKQAIKQYQKYSISGTVKDVSSGETLIGATIVVKGKDVGVVTNEYGFYSITLPQNTYTLQITYIGFESKEITIDLNTNKKQNVELSWSSNELDEIIVTSQKNTKSQVNNILLGTSSLQSDDIKKFPALLGEADVTRAILTQPGVTTVGEGATGFNVRGGNIDQNLILLDEAPIYNSSHVWGFFSIFNTDAIKDLKLYKGGIPARFGGRASSVLEIRQKEGSTKKFKAEGGLGLLFSRITLEGPIKKEKLSFLVSGRRSYFDLFFPLGGNELENTKVYFYDLNTKLKWDINENNKLFASSYFGADVMRLKFDGETNSNGVKDPDEEINFQWKNATATLRWNHILSNKLFMNVSGIYSRYDYSLSSKNDTGGGPANTSGTFIWKSAIENWIVKPDFTFYQNTNTKIRFGLNNTFYKFTPAKVTSVENGINSVNFKTEQGLEIAPYLEYEKKWNRFSLNAGLRYSWFGNIGPYNVAIYEPNSPKTSGTIREIKKHKKGEVIKNYTGFEPRLSLKYNVSNNKAIKVGYNRLFQYIHLISNTSAALPFDIWKPSGLHIKPLEVHQISAGYAYDTKSKIFNLTAEGYYKTFKNIVEYIDGANLFINENIETELLPAKGYSYGAEIGIHKSKGKLTGNLNYTYSVTKRKITNPFNSENAINANQYYFSNYDRPHIANLSTNYKLSKKWDAGIFVTYQTGRPTTLPTSRININNTSYLNYSSRNAFRVSDTHRMDVSFTYTPQKENKRWKNSWSFGVYNIYANKNAFSEYSSFNNGILKTFRFSVIGAPIPFITYNFKF